MLLAIKFPDTYRSPPLLRHRRKAENTYIKFRKQTPRHAIRDRMNIIPGICRANTVGLLESVHESTIDLITYNSRLLFLTLNCVLSSEDHLIVWDKRLVQVSISINGRWEISSLTVTKICCCIVPSIHFAYVKNGNGQLWVYAHRRTEVQDRYALTDFLYTRPDLAQPAETDLRKWPI